MSASSETRATRLRHDRRLQILDSAKQVFSELGYHNASVSEIIRRAGIARGTFYLYFTNKRKVFDAILSEAVDQLEQKIRIVSLQPGEPAPREQLTGNIAGVLSYLRDDRALTSLLLNHGLTPDAESAERVEAFYSHVTAMLESSIQRGIVMGLVRPCNTALIATCLFGAIKGAASYLLANEDAEVHALAAALIDFAAVGLMGGDASTDETTGQ